MLGGAPVILPQAFSIRPLPLGGAVLKPTKQRADLIRLTDVLKLPKLTLGRQLLSPALALTPLVLVF